MAAFLSSQQSDKASDLLIQKTSERYKETLLKLPKGKGWMTEHLVHYQGFWLTPQAAFKGLMLIQDHFNPRSTDIFLATFPKPAPLGSRLLFSPPSTAPATLYPTTLCSPPALTIASPFSSEEESKGTVEEIVKLCSFESLSNLKVNKISVQKFSTEIIVDNRLSFRKGKVGDWNNYLTADMIKRLNEITLNKLHGSGFLFSTT